PSSTFRVSTITSFTLRHATRTRSVYVRAGPGRALAPACGGELTQYLLGHAVDPTAIGRHHDIGDFRVERGARVHQMAEPRAGGGRWGQREEPDPARE